MYSFHYYAFNFLLKGCVHEHGLFLVGHCKLNIDVIKSFFYCSVVK